MSGDSRYRDYRHSRPRTWSAPHLGAATFCRDVGQDAGGAVRHPRTAAGPDLLG
ncbi:hypothetical protein ACFPM0_12350 [Pseudonocardia sulfidoxydans]|uniref:hypothetical protein n=1 Tax=Pseudonocardia sulfidoxydans TaxID=54011 RepID=UPI00361A1E4F